MEYRYKTKGVCSSQIILDIEGDTVKSAMFIGGCNGNLKGICALISGMKIDDIIEKCRGLLAAPFHFLSGPINKSVDSSKRRNCC
ncbi:MAG: TIGR03905 family TSCPD domain-containing protein [Acutalibacteraceae bacterium]